MTQTMTPTGVWTLPDRDYWPTDDWRMATPESQGLNLEVLDGIIPFARDTTPPTSGVVVIRHGYLVYEKYFNGYHKDSVHALASVSKSVTSAFTGIALKKGLLSLDQKVMEFFPELKHLDVDPRVHTMTLKHLLSMMQGWDKKTELTSMNLFKFVANPGFVEACLTRPMIHDPGTFFAYDSQGMNLLSTIVGRVSGMPAGHFAYEHMFKPMGIWTKPEERFQWRTREASPHAWHNRGALFDEEYGYPWTVDADGNPCAWGGLHLTLRDLAKFGYLYLNGGMWDGMEILPAGFVKESATPQSGGGSGPEPTVTPYGYLWWIPKSDTGMFHGWGAGRQFVYVIPSLDMVAAVTSRALPNDPGRVIDRFVLPAVTA